MSYIHCLLSSAGWCHPLIELPPPQTFVPRISLSLFLTDKDQWWPRLRFSHPARLQAPAPKHHHNKAAGEVKEQGSGSKTRIGDQGSTPQKTKGQDERLGLRISPKIEGNIAQTWSSPRVRPKDQDKDSLLNNQNSDIVDRHLGFYHPPNKEENKEGFLFAGFGDLDLENTRKVFRISCRNISSSFYKFFRVLNEPGRLHQKTKITC